MQRSIARLVSRRWCSTTGTPRGVREQFNEYEVRWRFNQWMNSLWLAPQSWVYHTRDRSARVTRRWLPFWNIDLQGSIRCSLSTKSTGTFRHDDTYYSRRQWHSFPLQLEKISLNSVNIYAAETFDRYHVRRLDVSFADLPLFDLSEEKESLEMATLDEDTGFHQAWILLIRPLLEEMCLERAKEKYPEFDDPRIDSFHLKIDSKEARLLYYPVYIINYNYRSRSQSTCLFDGITGSITGDRQYSATKVTLATLVLFYPLLKIGVFAFSSLADFLFAFEIASELSFLVSLPLALIVAPCVGLYARSYPKRYRDQLSQVQWREDQAKGRRFTYHLPRFDLRSSPLVSSRHSSKEANPVDH